MNYKKILSGPIQKIDFPFLFENITQNPKEFSKIYKLIYDKNEKVAWRSAWICEKISEEYPQFYTKDLLCQIMDLSINTSHTGLQRILLSILMNFPLPDDLPVEFINTCFERMISPKSPVAVQVLSMKILYKIIQKEPDLKPEFVAYLESVELENYTKGYKSAYKNILKKLID